jgi:hypothetical protein
MLGIVAIIVHVASDIVIAAFDVDFTPGCIDWHDCSTRGWQLSDKGVGACRYIMQEHAGVACTKVTVS